MHPEPETRHLVLKAVLSCLALTLAACSSVGQLDTTGTSVHIDLPFEDSGPTTLAIAEDGDVWFTLSTGNAIGRVDAEGDSYREYPIRTPDTSPRIIAAGSDGNMWFSEHAGNRMARITPEGVITEFPIPTTDSQPRAIALGSDGNIWFGEFAGNRIGRITPEGVITEFDMPRPNSGPGDITAGADGAMWFVELAGTMDGIQPDGNRIGRITMDGVITEYPIPSAEGTPINIAVGPDRNVWYTKGSSLGRVTPEGEITEFQVTTVPGRTVGLTAGSDRQPPDFLIERLWFTDPANNRIGWLEFSSSDD